MFSSLPKSAVFKSDWDILWRIREYIEQNQIPGILENAEWTYGTTEVWFLSEEYEDFKKVAPLQVFGENQEAIYSIGNKVFFTSKPVTIVYKTIPTKNYGQMADTQRGILYPACSRLFLLRELR